MRYQLPHGFRHLLVAGFAFRWRTLNFRTAKRAFERDAWLSGRLPEPVDLTGRYPGGIILSYFRFAIYFATTNQLEQTARRKGALLSPHLNPIKPLGHRFSRFTAQFRK